MKKEKRSNDITEEMLEPYFLSSNWFSCARASFIALIAFLAFNLTGCVTYVPFTYPSPSTTQGDHVVYPDAVVQDKVGYGHYSVIEEVCSTRLVGAGNPTHNAVAFVSDGIGFCFFGPEVKAGGWSKICNDTFWLVPSGPMDFQVLVQGNDVSFLAPRGMLVVDGKSSNVAVEAQVQGRTVAGSAMEAPSGAKPISPNGRRLLYAIPYWELTFHFDQPCDPHAQYQLKISGIANHGVEIQVPIIRFSPFHEWVLRGLD